MMDAYLPAGCETGLRFGLNPSINYARPGIVKA